MSEIRWYESFEDAAREAEGARRPILIDFWDPG